MAEEKVGRIFVGGLSWNTTERTLERTFGQYGKVIEAQLLIQRLQSVQFLHVRKLAKLQEKKFTNHLSSLVSIFAVMGSVKINWRHIHC
uniref:RRM domain-containing protein n=1 Tax=Zea mays TaxID=4577 RepID=B6SMQ0_MAIZE|nr:hypothetical protein [Zea mays]